MTYIRFCEDDIERCKSELSIYLRQIITALAFGVVNAFWWLHKRLNGDSVMDYDMKNSILTTTRICTMKMTGLGRCCTRRGEAERDSASGWTGDTV